MRLSMATDDPDDILLLTRGVPFDDVRCPRTYRGRIQKGFELVGCGVTSWAQRFLAALPMNTNNVVDQLFFPVLGRFNMSVLSYEMMTLVGSAILEAHCKTET